MNLFRSRMCSREIPALMEPVSPRPDQVFPQRCGVPGTGPRHGSVTWAFNLKAGHFLMGSLVALVAGSGALVAVGSRPSGCSNLGSQSVRTIDQWLGSPG